LGNLSAFWGDWRAMFAEQTWNATIFFASTLFAKGANPSWVFAL
jgi:hypothetical protein